jgi:hypothetical protein
MDLSQDGAGRAGVPSSEVGRRAEALAAGEEAVALRRDLVALDRPTDAFALLADAVTPDHDMLAPIVERLRSIDGADPQE